MTAPERSYVFSAGPLDAPLEHPPWAGGWHPEDLDELPHVLPEPLADPALVDVSQPMHVDEEGRLICGGEEVHPCCLESVSWGHGECTFDGFVNVPASKGNQRTFIPVTENWRGGR